MARRRYDPDRPQRIIDAAIRVVERDGIAGLSHRAVAGEADVPLGSTTYHFATLDDLLLAALRQVSTEAGTMVEDWRTCLVPGEPLSDGLARITEMWLNQRRGRVRLEYELYLAALRREALRPVAAEWLDAMVRGLEGYTRDLATARAVVALTDGLLLQHLLTGRSFDPVAARDTFARVLGE